MKSLMSSPKRTVKSYFEEITPFDLFYQLAHMSSIAAAGISRSRVFALARQLPAPTAHYFKSIHQVAENLRYTYPDAVQMIGMRVTQSKEVKTFLLRLSDALRSGEPLPGFLARETNVQSDTYLNDYETKLESLKKWSDAYTAVSVSASLIVVINMVMTMIYTVSPAMMAAMILVAISGAFGVGWIMFRTAPETLEVPLALGCKEQRLARKLALIGLPAAAIVSIALFSAGVPPGWVVIVAGIIIAPVGIVAMQADSKVAQKDLEISPFLRSLGGTATSRSTTLKEALFSMKIDSFPALRNDIQLLVLRLESFINPALCWRSFATETGSKLAEQATGIFFESVELGSDPEKTGGLTSMFAMRTAMLRAKRRGVAGTFTYLAMLMHVVMAGLMVFLLGVLEQFSVRLNEALSTLGDSSSARNAMGLGTMFSFGAPQIEFLTIITVGMIVLLALINSFAIVACEGAHLIKITSYAWILFIFSGLAILGGPSLAKLVM